VKKKNREVEGQGGQSQTVQAPRAEIELCLCREEKSPRGVESRGAASGAAAHHGPDWAPPQHAATSVNGVVLSKQNKKKHLHVRTHDE